MFSLCLSPPVWRGYPWSLLLSGGGGGGIPGLWSFSGGGGDATGLWSFHGRGGGSGPRIAPGQG